MMSCGGTSSASCRSETRTMRSIGANTRMMPGPFAVPSNRPSRKMTPRSYSARILIEFSKYKTTIAIGTRINRSGTGNLRIIRSLERVMLVIVGSTDGRNPNRQQLRARRDGGACKIRRSLLAVRSWPEKDQGWLVAGLLRIAGGQSQSAAHIRQIHRRHEAHLRRFRYQVDRSGCSSESFFVRTANGEERSVVPVIFVYHGELTQPPTSKLAAARSTSTSKPG